MPRLNARARFESIEPAPRAVRAVRSKKTTTERYQNKNRYGVPRGRIRASEETGTPIANRVAIGETEAAEGERGHDATKRYTSSSLVLSRLCF